jgi:hypothetical protein
MAQPEILRFITTLVTQLDVHDRLPGGETSGWLSMA